MEIESGPPSAVFFGALAAIDPGMELEIEGGTVTLVLTDAPDFRITAINAAAGNDDGDVSLSLHGRSDITGRLDLSVNADIQAFTGQWKNYPDRYKPAAPDLSCIPSRRHHYRRYPCSGQRLLYRQRV